MKKLLFLSIFLIISIICNAQTEKFETEFITIRTLNDTTKQYNNWDPWEETTVIITKDLHYVNIYSKVEHSFIIIGISEKVLFKGGENDIFDAIDQFDERCTIELWKFDTGKYHLYIRYLNVQILYQMKKL